MAGWGGLNLPNGFSQVEILHIALLSLIVLGMSPDSPETRFPQQH